MLEKRKREFWMNNFSASVSFSYYDLPAFVSASNIPGNSNILMCQVKESKNGIVK